MQPKLPKFMRAPDDDASEEMSQFDSQASRINFWKDINTKDEDYQGAIFLKGNNVAVQNQ